MNKIIEKKKNMYRNTVNVWEYRSENVWTMNKHDEIDDDIISETFLI